MSKMNSSDHSARCLAALIGLVAGVVCFGCFLVFQSRESSFGPLTGIGMGIPAIAETRPLVIVDAGHGGADGGAVAAGFIEKDLTLDMAQRLELELEQLGMRVIQTRSGDATLSLEERTQIANAHGEAVFVSLHFNTSQVPEVSGIETYHTSPKSLVALAGIKRRFGISAGTRLEDHRNRLLADEVQRAAVEAAGCEDRGVKNKSLRVTRETICPAVLVECAYLTNAGDVARMRDRAYRMALARGIARGIQRYIDAAAESGNSRFGLMTGDDADEEGGGEPLAVHQHGGLTPQSR